MSLLGSNMSKDSRLGNVINLYLKKSMKLLHFMAIVLVISERKFLLQISVSPPQRRSGGGSLVSRSLVFQTPRESTRQAEQRTAGAAVLCMV